MKRYPKIFLALLAVALVVTLTAAAPQAGEIKGKVMSVDPDNLSFVIQTATRGRTMPFGLDEDASIYINNQERSIQDLRAGDDVSIVGRQEGDTWLATIINVDRK